MADRTRTDEHAAMSRREFTSASVVALLSTVPITIAGCVSSNDLSTPTGPSPAVPLAPEESFAEAVPTPRSEAPPAIAGQPTTRPDEGPQDEAPFADPDDGEPAPPDGGDPPPPGDEVMSRTGVVGSNHGHDAVVTGAELIGGVDIVLDITGTADHPHTVAISVTELDQIANGLRVRKVSSTDDAHSHSVTFN